MSFTQRQFMLYFIQTKIFSRKINLTL